MREVQASMSRRVLAWALVASSTAAIAFAAPAAHAVPAAQSTTCNASFLLGFNPGLTLSERAQRIRVGGNLDGCSGGGVSSATVSGKGRGSLSCTSGTAQAIINLTWDTTERSQVLVTVDTSGNINGSVTRGKFAGETVSASLTITPLNGDCVFTPVTKASATGTVAL